jgi:hypothetical protein
MCKAEILVYAKNLSSIFDIFGFRHGSVQGLNLVLYGEV